MTIVNRRLAFALAAASCIPLGLGSKLIHTGELAWVAAHLGGAVYVIFWSLAVLTLWSNLNPLKVALIVCILTCGVEVLQLVQAPWLQAVRRTTAGSLILGSTFSWLDFPFYGGGCIAAWWCGVSIQSLLRD